MSGIVIYKSKYGATKKYAEWISEATGFECVALDKADMKSLSGYDTIVFGGGVYASGIAGINVLRKNIEKIRDKKIICYCCAASPYDEKFFSELVKQNLKDGLEGLPCFYCRGTFDLQGMSFADKTLCKMLRKAVAKKSPDEYEVWEAALMSVGENEKGDWTDRSYIDPILKCISGAAE